MLPNFRKAEGEGQRLQPNFAANDGAQSFAPRPVIASSQTGERRAASVIGADLTIVGNLVSKGEVQVDGIVEGDVHGSHVIIGETATITGSILSEEVVVRGHVIGSVHSKRVMLQSTSQVEGDIFHQSLSIEQGAMFEGKSRRSSDDPRTAAATNTKKPAAPSLAFTTPPRLPDANSELPN